MLAIIILLIASTSESSLRADDVDYYHELELQAGPDSPHVMKQEYFNEKPEEPPEETSNYSSSETLFEPANEPTYSKLPSEQESHLTESPENPNPSKETAESKSSSSDGRYETSEPSKETPEPYEQSSSSEDWYEDPKPSEEAPEPNKKIISSQTPSDVKTPLIEQLRKLSDKNPDIVGWIVLDGTTINYPLMQAADNKYYLTHDADKKYTSQGSIFLDYRLMPDFSDINNIIYGHNTDSDTIFSGLTNFKNKSYFDTHKTGTLYTIDKTYDLEIFSVYVHHYLGNPYSWYFLTQKYFNEFTEQIKADSLYYRETELEWGDRILTLSTCSYEFTNARTIVHARLVERG